MKYLLVSLMVGGLFGVSACAQIDPVQEIRMTELNGNVVSMVVEHQAGLRSWGGETVSYERWENGQRVLVGSCQQAAGTVTAYCTIQP